MATLFTIGYEAASLDQCISALTAAGVERVIDVREAPRSRKAGFSKGALAAALAEAGVDYLHLRPLGTPKPGRVAAHKGDLETFERIFREHLAGEEAQAALAQAAAIAGERRCCLLCFERDPARCHRSIVADAMADLSDIEIVHLVAEAEPSRAQGPPG
ncbi:MAG: DUF488 family protein [Alphaproteobacteria bacterium]